MNEMQVLTRRRIRGYILRCLSLYSGEYINLEVVADFVRTCGISASNNEVEEQVDYLHDKGYVRVTEKGDSQISTKKTVTAQISVQGIDLVEGTTGKDPGIMLPQV